MIDDTEAQREGEDMALADDGWVACDVAGRRWRDPAGGQIFDRDEALARLAKDLAQGRLA